MDILLSPCNFQIFRLDSQPHGFWAFGDGTTSNVQNPSHTYTSLGNHTVSLTVSNNGQHNSTKANYITIDTIYATITSTPASLTDATTAGFGFSATRSDATFLCQLDTGTFLPCTNPWSYSSLSAGSHRFTVEAVGSTGYIFPSVSYSWTIDLTPPHTNHNPTLSDRFNVRRVLLCEFKKRLAIPV